MIESADLPNNERVYLKKDIILGWRVVEPIKDPDTKKINWFNLLVGGRKGLVFLLLILFLSVAFYFGINELISNYKLIADNPCMFCSDCQAGLTAMKSSTINFTLK
jgi:hypothetical protein